MDIRLIIELFTILFPTVFRSWLLMIHLLKYLVFSVHQLLSALKTSFPVTENGLFWTEGWTVFKRIGSHHISPVYGKCFELTRISYPFLLTYRNCYYLHVAGRCNKTVVESKYMISAQFILMCSKKNDARYRLGKQRQKSSCDIHF